MKTLATFLLLSLASLCAAAANASPPPGQALRARLLSPATVSLRVDGKVSGETKLPAGTVLEVVREGEKRVLLKSGFGQHWIDKDKLEIERAESTPPATTASARPLSTPSKPASPPSTTESSGPQIDDPLSGLDLPFLSTGDDVSGDSGTDEDSSGSRTGRYSYDSTPLVDLPLDDLKSQAAAGDPIAQIELGHRHRRGFGVDKNTVLAAEWYGKASRQGNPGGDMCLARMNLSGLTDKEPASWENAFRLLDELAANTDRSAALHYAGLCHLLGRGTPVDHRKAAKLFETFALGRDFNPYRPDSMWELGQIHENGKGVPRNKAKAIEWFEKAALNGHSEARKWLQSAAKKGDRLAISALEKLATNKKPRP